jgi:bacterioferritin-associated ferredoxin
MYICVCNGIKAADVRHLGRQGIIQPERLLTVLKLEDDDCCGRCADNIDEFVDLAVEAAMEPIPAMAAGPIPALGVPTAPAGPPAIYALTR